MCARVVAHPPSRPMLFLKRPSFCRRSLSTLSLAAWWNWYLWFYRVDDRCGEQINHTRRAMGLDRLVDSGNDPSDSSWQRVRHIQTTDGQTVERLAPFAHVCSVQSDQRGVRTLEYTMLWSESALAGGGGCGTMLT